MEKKKSFNLESKRKIYFSLGLFIVSAGVLCAFTYRTPVNLRNNILGLEQEADVPLLLVENEIKPEKPELPVVEKIPEPKSATPIFNDQLLNNITPVGNIDKTPKSTITSKNIKITIIDTLGSAPKLEEVVRYPDQEAKFIGNWSKYLVDSLVYPVFSSETGEAGTVIVSFVVERDGGVSSIKVLNKTRVSRTLQEEAVRVVKGSPKWKPGSNNGEKVRSNMIVHINFVLEG